MLAAERRAGERPSVVTQFRNDDGQRPDLIVFLDEKPWIVVESKVEHTATLDQLANYAGWMREASREAPFGITLVFLTHSTPCPVGFVETNSVFAGVALARRRWAGIGRALLQACDRLENNHESQSLCASFFHQLEDLNMSNEYPSSKTMAAAQMFMLFGLEMELLVNSLLEDVSGIGNFSHQKYTSAQPEFSQGLYSGGRWAKSVRGTIGAQVWVGLWFPETGSYRVDVEREMKIDVSAAPKIFTTVDSEELLAAVPGCPNGWYRDDEEYLAFANYDTFADDPTERANAAKAWVRDRIAVLKTHLVEG
ncbi:hypothetical protein [Aurantiacibacter atlanticus]|nr:hypothetical protein [Aurantiacibacter atlanticus]